jgi:FkbM family methyltransferase
VRSVSSLLANARRVPEVLACSRETWQWLPVTLDYLGLRLLEYPYELRLRTGQVATLREHTDVVVLWMIFARQHYPVRSSDQTIVDAGANIGLFTLYAARQAPSARIVAVEPFPDTSQALLGLIDRNNLRNRVTVLDRAVAGSGGTGTMDADAAIPSQYRRIQSPVTATLNLEHRGAVLQTGVGVPVSVKTLSEVLDGGNVVSADLLKMNIHGSEYEVLMSASADTLRRCKRIAMQYHDLPAEIQVGKKELFEHLDKVGFRLISDQDTRTGSGLALLQLETC